MQGIDACKGSCDKKIRKFKVLLYFDFTIMFAIVFDMDTQTLKEVYPNESWNNAYTDIRSILEDEGFSWQQGSVYFGTEKIDAVACVLAAQRLAVELAWFEAAVRDIRMLRIEANNDLGPAVERAAN